MENTLVYRALAPAFTAYAVYLLTIGISLIFPIIYDETCDDSGPAYRYAQSLSQQRLTLIHQTFKNQAKLSHSLSFRKTDDHRLQAFDDLDYTYVSMRSWDLKRDTATMRLGSCMDQSIDLILQGIQSERPVIKLVWGELNRTEEILWQGTTYSPYLM